MIKKPRRPVLISFVITALMCGVIFVGLRGEIQKVDAAKKQEIERSELKAIDYRCAPWKADTQQFDACGSAFRVFEKCEIALFRMLHSQGDMSDEGVVCEHPVYQFHARFQKEMDDVIKGAH